MRVGGNIASKQKHPRIARAKLSAARFIAESAKEERVCLGGMRGAINSSVISRVGRAIDFSLGS